MIAMRHNDKINHLSQKYFRYMDVLPFKSQLKEFLNLSLERCMKAVKAQSGSIFLLDDDKEELVLEIVRNSKDIVLEGLRERLGEGIAGRVALERKPILVGDMDSEVSLGYKPRFNHYHSKSFLSVPLEFSGDLIGVVNITDKFKGTFDHKDLRVVVTISMYLGIALHSLKNYLEEQKRRNEELTKELGNLKKSAEQSKKLSSLGKVVGGLVHEINNPLDGVIRYFNLAFDCVEEEGLVKEYLQEAKAGLARIATIVRSLLDFCWSLSPQEGQIDTNRVIEESLFLFSHYIVSKNIEVKKYLAPQLPKLPDYRLKLVFNNIIKNACEAMRRGGTLIVYTAVNNSFVEIRFKDTGQGIAPELQSRIFEPFFTTKNMGEGSGLGLAISYEIVQRYKGNIFVESEPEKGTTFIIQLPITTS